MSDKQKKQEHATWEALHDVHDSIVNALKESSTNMMGVYSTKGLASFIRGDKNEVRISIYGLARDRKVFDKELREIKQSYADKKGIIGGDAVDEDDARQARLLDLAQERGGEDGALGIGRHAKHGDVRGRKRRPDRAKVFRPAHDVDGGPVLSHEAKGADRGDTLNRERLASAVVKSDERLHKGGLA